MSRYYFLVLDYVLEHDSSDGLVFNDIYEGLKDMRKSNPRMPRLTRKGVSKACRQVCNMSGTGVYRKEEVRRGVNCYVYYVSKES